MAELFAATGDSVAHIIRQGDIWNVNLTLKDSSAQCLTLDPHHSSTLYVGTHGKGVWKSSDNGQTWQNMRLPQEDVFSIAVSSVDDAVYAGCEPSMLFRSEDGGHSWQELSALRSIPSAPTWSFPPRPWTSHVRWIAPNPHDAALLIVGIELGGLMYSSDGGQTWSDHRPNAQRDVHALAWHTTAPGRAYEAGGGGTAWSRDGGQTWQRIDTGRDRHYTWGLAVDPDDPDCWFISACPGPREAHNPRGNAQAFIYRWRGNGPWQALNGGLPQPLKNFPYALVSAPGQLFAGLNDGRIYVSDDLGDSWQLLTLTGDSMPSILGLAYYDLTEEEKTQIVLPHFSWLVEQKLAALSYPESEDAFILLWKLGIRAMINLAEEPLPGETLRKVGILIENIPVVDFTAPTLHQVEQALAMIHFCLDREMPVAVHCIAGLGRTGTILACYLVGQGISAEEAIITIRKWRPGSIEISEQEAVIYEYEHLLRAQVYILLILCAKFAHFEPISSYQVNC